MSSKPMIIFLPVRNGGEYVREAIDSIIAQRDPDWRLIVLENASTDATVATVEGYQDSRITLVPAERPLDIYENWHRAWTWLEKYDLADELVTTIGHDDALDVDFVGTVRALAAAHPQATLYQSMFNLIDSEGDLIRPCRPVPETENWQELAAALCWGIRDSFGTGYAFHARDYRRVGGIPKFTSLLYSDHLLFIRLTRLGYKVSIDQALCRYRLHPTSESNSVSRGTVNAYIETLDGFVAVLMTEFASFAETEFGRNALACLIGRQLATFDRPGIRHLLSHPNRERLMRLRAIFSTLSPTVAPEAWAGMRDSQQLRRLKAVVGVAKSLRVRARERFRR